ncbi:unnamed protein product [Prorocentrum cordatum]|uniref:Feruloyl esterase n=1 Tax=Prorocentrum cordatum TaxID=2364126 RepID=A0ABN9PQM1_9DINO|nr:unnamed protein product [Polarella glacialis]CAK0795417.1 unnamed protein product [Polarella glacialis]
MSGSAAGKTMIDEVGFETYCVRVVEAGRFKVVAGPARRRMAVEFFVSSARLPVDAAPICTRGRPPSQSAASRPPPISPRAQDQRLRSCRRAADWRRRCLGAQVEALTRDVIYRYRGDPARAVLTGQSAGGAGAWDFAALRPMLWSAVNVICMPADPEVASHLEGVPVWVVGWTGDGYGGNDDVVAALKQRKSGETRYTRYTQAPAPPDPKYRDMLNHASYDLIYRDPRLWAWALQHRRPEAVAAWSR